jgi:hypothetical protein
MLTQTRLTILAVMTGIALAFLTYHQASAANMQLRWMSSVSANWKFCFGIAGWHFTTAADLFADVTSPCGSTPASPWAFTYGNSGVGSYQLLGVVVNSTQDGTFCHAARADVYRLNPDLSPVLIGKEQFVHVDPSGNLPDWYTVYMGNNAWTWSSNNYSMGSTIYPEGLTNCDNEAHHVHQFIRELGSGVSYSLNSGFSTNGIYDLFNVANYVHHWQWSQ